jgi:hypothetical protein
MKTTNIEELLDELTLEEQVSLLTGADFWTTVPIPRLGVPAIKVVPRHVISWERGRFSGTLFRGKWHVGYGVI